VVGRQVLRGGGHPHEHRGLADTGDQPGEDQHPERRGEGQPGDRHGHDRRAAHRQDPPALGVTDAADPRAQQGGRHRVRAHADAHLHATAAELALDVAGNRGQQRAHRREVGERREHDDGELRGQQASLVGLEWVRGDVTEHESRLPSTLVHASTT
jgi:hypothetical protein